MKIAVSGAHWTGKTTLVGELCQVFPDHLALDEPYYQLVEEGHVFAEDPGIEDFELQLACSIKQINTCNGNIIFDRCPADLLAYVITHTDFGTFDMDTWLPQIQQAIAQLDFIIFVPLEEPDLIECPDMEYPELRRQVDEALYDILLKNTWGFDPQALEVHGSPSERVSQVLLHVNK